MPGSDLPRANPRRRLGSVWRFATGTVRHGCRAAGPQNIASLAGHRRYDSARTRLPCDRATDGRKLAWHAASARWGQLCSMYFHYGMGYAGVAGDEEISNAAIREAVQADLLTHGETLTHVGRCEFFGFTGAAPGDVCVRLLLSG